MMNASDPRGPHANLLYWNQNRRSQRRQALSIALVLASSAAAAYAAMNAASDPLLINTLWLDIGKLAAILLLAISCSRFVTQLVLAASRPNQTIYLYDQGFTWHQGRSQKRYRWNQVQQYHENLRNPALFPWGSLRFRMEDERVYRLRPAHGNLRRIARLIRPYLAQAAAQKMRAQLQHDRPVRLNRNLLVWPNGVTIRSREIAWPELELRIRHGRLQFRQRRTNGSSRIVKSIPLHKISHVAGFLQLSQSAMRGEHDLRYVNH
ncbi:MAG: hypothetical protein OXF22_06230 [Anaerolineaceae bacterium]|nr:hypothetical protein [Anaerolineaceae bacterium]